MATFSVRSKPTTQSHTRHRCAAAGSTAPMLQVAHTCQGRATIASGLQSAALLVRLEDVLARSESFAAWRRAGRG